MQPNELARKMCEEVYGQGKMELIPQLLTDDYSGHDPIAGKLSRSTIEANVQQYRRAFPDLTMQVIDQIATGDKGMIRWRATGTHRGELLGVKPTNNKVTIEGISEVRCVNGKIAEAWEQWDALGLMRQIGAVPEMAVPKRDGGGKPAAPTQQRR
jgi:steroid delta-isomerase-like uncharacterized protein